MKPLRVQVPPWAWAAPRVFLARAGLRTEPQAEIFGGNDVSLPREIVAAAQCRLHSSCWWIDVALEDLGPPRYNERYRLNVGVVDGLVRSHDFILMEVDTPLGDEGEPSLRFDGLVLGQELELVIGVFKVANVSITESR